LYICVVNVTYMDGLSKKDQITAAAGELFWKHGFRRISVAEICTRAGVSRKTYYTYYNNKNELILSMLTELFESGLNKAKEIFDSEISFEEKIRKIMDFKITIGKTWSKEFLTEMMQTPVISEFYLQWAQKSLQLSRDFFANAQKKGQVNPDLHIDFVMFTLQKYMDWIDDPAFMKYFDSVEDFIRQSTYLFLYGVMPVHKE